MKFAQLSLSAALILSLFSPILARAHDLNFTLDCQWSGEAGKEPKGSPQYKVQKTAYKDGGRWTAKYSLIETLPGAEPVSHDFASAESGDEDYLEYNLVESGPKSAISGGAIQNAFKWANLSNQDGQGVYDCR